MNYADRKDQIQLEFRQIRERLEFLEAERAQLANKAQQLVGKTDLLNELIEEEKKKTTPPPPPPSEPPGPRS